MVCRFCYWLYLCNNRIDDRIMMENRKIEAVQLHSTYNPYVYNLKCRMIFYYRNHRIEDYWL